MNGLLSTVTGCKRPARLAALVALVLGGCSHTSPYVASTLAPGGVPAMRIDDAEVVTRLLLIGDAGQPAPGEPVLAELARWGARVPDRTTIVFLGDNIYPWGLVADSDPEHAEMSRRLAEQIRAVEESGARGIFIPGNHDWGPGGPEGLARIQGQERAVEAALGPDAFIPAGGCAGPEAVDLDGLRLVIFDSQWFLQEPPASPCAETKESIANGISKLIAQAGDREVIVIAHHPIASHGPHGGFFEWRDHVFPLTRLAPWAYVPLPVVGSLYPLYRGVLNPSRQDIADGRYEAFIACVTDAVRVHRPLAYADGHDHVLQVLDGGEAFRYLLVSGAGAEKKVTATGHGDDTLFAHAAPGFMCIDVLEGGRVALRIVEPGADVVYSWWLAEEGPDS